MKLFGDLNYLQNVTLPIKSTPPIICMHVRTAWARAELKQQKLQSLKSSLGCLQNEAESQRLASQSAGVASQLKSANLQVSWVMESRLKWLKKCKFKLQNQAFILAASRSESELEQRVVSGEVMQISPRRSLFKMLLLRLNFLSKKLGIKKKKKWWSTMSIHEGPNSRRLITLLYFLLLLLIIFEGANCSGIVQRTCVCVWC